MSEACWICGKEKGRPPQGCGGHGGEAVEEDPSGSGHVHQRIAVLAYVAVMDSLVDLCRVEAAPSLADSRHAWAALHHLGQIRPSTRLDAVARTRGFAALEAMAAARVASEARVGDESREALVQLCAAVEDVASALARLKGAVGVGEEERG